MQLKLEHKQWENRNVRADSILPVSSVPRIRFNDAIRQKTAKIR